MPTKKEYKTALSVQNYGNEGHKTENGFSIFGVIIIALSFLYGYICIETQVGDLARYAVYPIGFGLFLILIGKLINRHHQRNIHNYEQYAARQKARKNRIN